MATNLKFGKFPISSIPKANLNSKKKEVDESKAAISVVDKAEVAKVTQETFLSIRYNDKALTNIEIDYEKNAEILNINIFPRIHPRKATIGYMVRGMEGGNYQAIEYARASLPASNKHGTIKSLMVDEDLRELIKEFDKLDENSKSRVDCLDWLCRRADITTMKFISNMRKGLVEYHSTMAEVLISESKPALAQTIRNFAAKKEHVADRKLAAQMSGLIGDEKQTVVNIDNSKTDNSKSVVVPTFADFMRDKQVKMIEDGNTVDGEIVND